MSGDPSLRSNPLWNEIRESICRALAESVTAHNELRLALELKGLSEKIFGAGSFEKVTGKPQVIGLSGSATKVGLIFLLSTVRDKRLLGLTWLTRHVVVHCEPANQVPFIDATLDSAGNTRIEFRQLPLPVEFNLQQQQAIAARVHAKALWLNLPKSEQSRYDIELRSDGGPVSKQFETPERDFAYLASLWLNDRKTEILRLTNQEQIRLNAVSHYWLEYYKDPFRSATYAAGS